jgi:tetratricopeptide (TPR) repeat protein
MTQRWLPANLSLVLLSASCGTVSVISNPPEAEVSIVLPGKESLKPLGKTPLEVPISNLEGAVNQGTVVLVVDREGYVPQRFIVPNLGGGKLSIEATLSPFFDTNYQEFNNVIGKVLKAERLVLEKRLDEALATAKEIKAINENVAVAHEIEGTALFLKGDFANSRFAWIRALELDPNNHESRTMLDVVTSKLNPNGQKPAGNQSKNR